MKKVLIILFILLCVGVVTGADKSLKVTEFEKCANLSVSVEQSFGSSYYLEGCNETSINKWFCNCHDNYELYIKILDDSLDDYQFRITHNWLEFSFTGSDVVTIEKTESISLVHLYHKNHCNTLCGDGVCMDSKYCVEDKTTCGIDCLLANETKENTSAPIVQKISPPLEEQTPVFMILIIFTVSLLLIATAVILIIAYYMSKKQDEFENLKDTLKYENLQDFIKEDKK